MLRCKKKWYDHETCHIENRESLMSDESSFAQVLTSRRVYHWRTPKEAILQSTMSGSNIET
jgi:hypothetical protein